MSYILKLTRKIIPCQQLSILTIIITLVIGASLFRKTFIMTRRACGHVNWNDRHVGQLCRHKPTRRHGGHPHWGNEILFLDFFDWHEFWKKINLLLLCSLGWLLIVQTVLKLVKSIYWDGLRNQQLSVNMKFFEHFLNNI